MLYVAPLFPPDDVDKVPVGNCAFFRLVSSSLESLQMSGPKFLCLHIWRGVSGHSLSNVHFFLVRLPVGKVNMR